jgi:sensor domain CHASE-containing protein
MGSIVVSQNGTLVYSKSVGKADVETNKNISFNQIPHWFDFKDVHIH